MSPSSCSETAATGTGQPLPAQDSRYRHRTAATGTGQPLPAQDSRYRHRTAATGTGQPLPAQDVYNDGEGAFVDV